MKQFKVLIEKEYKVATFVPVFAENGAEAYKAVAEATKQVRHGALDTKLHQEIVTRFGQIEEAIDQLGEDSDFVLNGPSETHQGVVNASQDQWSRPVVMEEGTATAAV